MTDKTRVFEISKENAKEIHQVLKAVAFKEVGFVFN